MGAVARPSMLARMMSEITARVIPSTGLVQAMVEEAPRTAWLTAPTRVRILWGVGRGAIMREVQRGHCEGMAEAPGEGSAQ